MLVSSLQQRDSVIHIHNIFFFRFFSLIDYHNILSLVPCAILWVLVVYDFIYSSIHVNPKLLIYLCSPPLLSSWVTIRIFIFIYLKSVSIIRTQNLDSFVEVNPNT